MHYRCISSRRLERERPLDVLTEVLEVGVVVDGRGDLGRRVAERALDGAEVDARLAKQRRVRVAQVVEPELPRDR